MISFFPKKHVPKSYKMGYLGICSCKYGLFGDNFYMLSFKKLVNFISFEAQSKMVKITNI